MNVLVIGGAGRTGRRIAELLARNGHRVTTASRRPRGTHTVTLDLAQPLPDGLLRGTGGVVIAVEPPMDRAGAQAVAHHGIRAVAESAARAATPVVLLTQIYVERAAEHSDMADIITARAAGERALRLSGAPYAIVRPAWLVDRPLGRVRLEQGDTGDGQVSRDAVARAAVAALTDPAAHGRTFEIYQEPAGTIPDDDWPALFAGLVPDSPA